MYYIGLSTTAPSIDGTGVTEPGAYGTGYARVPIDNLSAPSNGEVANESIVAFDESLSNWGMARYYVVFDAQSGGNLLAFEELSEARSMETNSVMMFKAGEISFSVTNESA